MNPAWMAIPAFFDVLGSILKFIALTMVTASVYQMMRGLICAITAFFSITFLKKTLYRHHFVGVFLITLGVFVVGLIAVQEEKSG